jgi:DNA repair exonuclease SbcCD ATPase subunit
MAMIAMLLAAPYSDISVEALTGAPHTPTRQTVLDARARDELRKRISRLHQQIEQADANGDTTRSLQLSDELDRITTELERTLRPGGNSREFVTPAERARTSAQKAIRRALERIGEQAPDLAEKLTRSIHTGAYCRFQPADDLPHAWITTG